MLAWHVLWFRLSVCRHKSVLYRKSYEGQLTLANPRDALHHCEPAATE